MSGITILIIAAAAMACTLGGVSLLAHVYTLNNIKSKTVGDGQHGSARWATKSEIKRVYRHIPFTPNKWRAQAKNGVKPTCRLTNRKKSIEEELPQGIIVGCKGGKKNTMAMVDAGDVHALMIGAAGVGKTAYWLYPCIEYACASGMSFLSTDTKGDVMRNYGGVAKEYGYNVSVIDLRNPTKSNGNNLLNLVNKYMDLYKEHPNQLAYKTKAEKYAKIISKTIILSGTESASFGQNAYFYDAAEGILTATILLVAEFCEPQKRHIVSVFKIIQELLAPSEKRNKNQFQELMALLPNDHKAKWFAGAALNASDQSMASVMSTALSRLNAFLDSELEQILCFDTEIDAEKFCSEKSAIFIIMPEEAPTTFFMISLIIQQLYREILALADEEGGKLKNRCIFFCDEFGTLPKIQDAEMIFSASRSRRLQIVPIIQSFSQLDKNYGKEGEEIIVDNTQLTIFGGFAPNSPSAEVLSKALGRIKGNAERTIRRNENGRAPDESEVKTVFRLGNIFRRDVYRNRKREPQSGIRREERTYRKNRGKILSRFESRNGRESKNSRRYRRANASRKQTAFCKRFADEQAVFEDFVDKKAVSVVADDGRRKG